MEDDGWMDGRMMDDRRKRLCLVRSSRGQSPMPSPTLGNSADAFLIIPFAQKDYTSTTVYQIMHLTGSPQLPRERGGKKENGTRKGLPLAAWYLSACFHRYTVLPSAQHLGSGISFGSCLFSIFSASPRFRPIANLVSHIQERKGWESWLALGGGW